MKSFVRALRFGMTAARSSCPKLRMLSAMMNRVPASKWEKRYGTTQYASMELPSVAGMVENRPFEMSVEMLSPSSAAEVCEADAGRYNTRAVLPQGAFYVQSIRASQTADPRSKQTRPSGLARRSARVNPRPGNGELAKVDQQAEGAERVHQRIVG